MRLPTTIFLLAVVAGLIFYVVGYERDTPGTKEKLERQTRPFGFNIDDADSLKITVANKKDIELEKVNGEWFMERPVKDRANVELVKQLLEAASGIEWFETFTYDSLGKGDRRDSGINDDSPTLIISKGKERLAGLRFGGKSTIEGASYATMATKDKPELVHLTRSTLASLVQVQPEMWRDNKLVRAKADDVTGLSLDAGGGAMEFERAGVGQPWNLIKPLRTRASDERVNAVLAAILNFDAQPTQQGGTGESSTPPLKITIERAGGAPRLVINLHASAEAGSPVRAEVTGRSGAFLTAARAHDFWKLQPNHLRDQNLARIDSSALMSLGIKSQNFGDVLMSKQGENWMLKRFGVMEPANHERIARLIDRLNIEQIRNFVTDAATNLAPYGLDQPFLDLSLGTKDKSSHLLFGTGAENKIFARYDDEPFVYQISPTLFDAIPPELTKWRSLKVVNESLFSVRRLIIAEGESPPLVLNYDPEQALWNGKMAERDITPQIESASANKLLQQLVNFEVSDWSTDRSDAYAALKNPSLTIQLLLAEHGKPEAEARTVTLLFAPITTGMSTAIYHGRLEGDPDTFLITRDLYKELLTPLVN